MTGHADEAKSKKQNLHTWDWEEKRETGNQ